VKIKIELTDEQIEEITSRGFRVLLAECLAFSYVAKKGSQFRVMIDVYHPDYCDPDRGGDPDGHGYVVDIEHAINDALSGNNLGGDDEASEYDDERAIAAAECFERIAKRLREYADED
jgi:hypothetical protein